MSKAQKPRRFGDLVGRTMADVFARQGFASMELVTRWPEIVGRDVAAHSEPIRIVWPRKSGPGDAEPATLVLRVEGPASIEIQHQSSIILERVNRFFGWRAVGRLALRQAPLTRRDKPKTRPVLDHAAASDIAASLHVRDDALRLALGRLGAFVKRGA